MNWLIDKLGFEEVNLIKELNKRNIRVFGWDDYLSGNVNVEYVNPLFFKGSLDNISDEMWNVTRFTEPDLFCYTNFAVGGSEYMLNNDYAFIPAEELLKQVHTYYRAFSNNDGEIFVRSEDGEKGLSGQLINVGDLEAVLNKAFESKLSRYEWLVVSSPKDIFMEVRYVVSVEYSADNAYNTKIEILTSSSYLIDGNLALIQDNSPKPMQDLVVSYVENLIKVNPYVFCEKNIFVVDACETSSPKNQYKILECNALETSGLYNLNVKSILNKIEKFYG